MTELYEKGPFGYIVFFDDGLIYNANDTAAGLLKYEKNELKGLHVEKIFTLSTRIFYQTHFYPLIKIQGHAEEIFLTLLTSDAQHLPVLLNASRDEIDQHAVTCFAFIVVHNRKKFEDELVAARQKSEKALQENTALHEAKENLQQRTEQLEQQMQLVYHQNEELHQFHHVITHSLMEPVRKVLMYTSMAQADVNTPEFKKILESAGNMKSIVSGLQQFVWLNEKQNEFSQVNLKEIVQTVTAQLEEENADNFLELQYGEFVSFDGDAEQIRLLVYHILLNAIQYRRLDKSTVTISAFVLKKNTFRNLERKYNYEDFVQLDFTDNGIGFDPMYKTHIFELFRKLHHKKQGLGLALCKKIALNHGGFISADSVEDNYTTITVWFPLKQTGNDRER